MTDETARRVAVAERAATAGAEHAADLFRTDLDVETKDGKTDVVTRADREAQRRVIEVIGEAFPEDAIVGEEDDERKTVPEDGAAWVIDPIDGTNNFVRGVPVWATSVAAVVDGEPVGAANVLPALDESYVADGSETRLNGQAVSVSDEDDPEACAVCPTIYWDWDRRDEYSAACDAIVRRFGDLRRYGCAQAVLSMVATGGLDGVVTNVAANPWDSVAGVHAVRRAGGTVTDLHGDRWRHDSTGIVASNGEIHEELLDVARAVEDAR